MVLALRASYNKKTIAGQVIPLAPGYWTALLSCPDWVPYFPLPIREASVIYGQSLQQKDKKGEKGNAPKKFKKKKQKP